MATSTGLVAHWKLDEGRGASAADSTGNGNSATLRNEPTWATGGAPLKAPNPASLVFDGVVDELYVPTVGNQLPAVDGPKTLAAWIRPDPISPGKSSSIVALANVTVMMASTSVQLGFRFGRLVAWKAGGSELVGAEAPSPGVWHQIAYTFDGVTHLLYIDGTLAGTGTTASQAGSVNTVRLGFWNPQERYAGGLDDVRIYDRPLGPSEIAALAQGL